MPTGTPIDDIDLLHQRAVEETGLTDFGDPIYRAALRILLESYDEDAELTPAGARRFGDLLVSVLCSRLRTRRAWREHPEYSEQVIRRPIFVTGLPRTGTTILHRLLCAVPGTQGLEHWLADSPQPRPPHAEWSGNADFRRTQDWLDGLYEGRPGFQGVHFMSAGEVEECWRLERQSMLCLAYTSMAHLPGYSGWLLDQDFGPGYRVHRDALALIGLGSADRWVLKSPAHLFALDALLAVYPDALVVQTHRDPRTAIASLSSLNWQAGRGASTAWTPEVVGHDALALWSQGVARFAASRRRHEGRAEAEFVDVHYADLARDPVGVVESIHDRFRLPWGRTRVRRSAPVTNGVGPVRDSLGTGMRSRTSGCRSHRSRTPSPTTWPTSSTARAIRP